jgi:hypothetical protein
MWFAVGLFILLSPGILVSLPSFTLLSEKTSLIAILLHAIIFGVSLEIIRRYSLTDLIEGFQDSRIVEEWKPLNGCGQKICLSDKPVCREGSDGIRFCSET